MKPCPECDSKNVYRYKEPIAAEGAYGPLCCPNWRQAGFPRLNFCL